MKHNRTSLVALTLAVVPLQACTTTSQSQTSRPNIIYILADDLGYGDLTCLNKDSKIHTPYMDALAIDGMTFTDAHTSSSVSTPSRYGVLTGRYNWRTRLKRGVLGGYSRPLIAPERPTLASILKEHGYKTACIGKWHLGMGWYGTNGEKLSNQRKLSGTSEPVDYARPLWDTPIDHGFDYFYGISASLDIPPYVMIENRQSEIPDTEWLGEKEEGKYMRKGVAKKGRKPEDYLFIFADKVVESIEQYAKQDNPFFIYFPMPAPHTPVVPTAAYKGRSQAGDYGDYVIEIDDIVGRIEATLKKLGMEKNTMIVLTSDNGPERIAYPRAMKYQHRSAGNLRGLKRDLWEGGHRVPFILKYPAQVKAGMTVDQTICLVDFYATLQEMLGDTVHSKGGEDSFSMLSLMRGTGPSARDFTIHHSCNGEYAIRRGPWVLIDAKDGNNNRRLRPAQVAYYDSLGYKQEAPHFGELFNLDADEAEYNNVYGKHPEIVKDLKKILEDSKKADSTRQ